MQVFLNADNPGFPLPTSSAADQALAGAFILRLNTECHFILSCITRLAVCQEDKNNISMSDKIFFLS